MRTGTSMGAWLCAVIAVVSMSACSTPGPEAVATTSEALGGSIELVAGNRTYDGYDFDTQTYAGASAGDFYFYQGAFWSNNGGQRGIVSVGACASVDSVTTMPLTGYTRGAVGAVLGRCYVALTHNDERDHIVFRVTGGAGAAVFITWKLVPSGDWAATLVSASNTAGGYDFDARVYTGLSGGDFYLYQGAFWANNTGQRGLVSVGACTSVDAVASVPMTGYSGFDVPAVAGNCYVSLGQNEEHGNIVFRVDATTATTAMLTFKIVDDCYGLADPRQNVGCWLTKNPTVGGNLVWENRLGLGSTTPVAWAQWPNALRDDLRNNFVSYTKLLANTITQDPDPLVDPPVNQAVLADSDFPSLVLSPTDAWRLYVKTIAMSLAVELGQSVPWSVTTYDAPSLASLFDGHHLLTYTWSGNPAIVGLTVEGYLLVDNNYDATTHTTFAPYGSYATPAPPDQALQFVRAKGLQGATRLATITNTLQWARRLQHYEGSQTTGVFQRVWGYRGPAPVTVTLAATLDPVTDPNNAYHFTAGCHGTAGFLRSILRTLNIPVDNDMTYGHSLTRFMTEGLYMSHGDDPYSGTDIFYVPASAFLISEATYAAWTVDATQAGQNLGRANPEADIQYLSGKLQYEYCLDPPNTPPANSLVLGVFSRFSGIYTASYLQNLPPDPMNPSLPPSLWDRLAQSIAAQGGCTPALNTLFAQQHTCNAVQPAAERLDCNW